MLRRALLAALAAAASAWPTRDASCDGALVRLELGDGGGTEWGMPSALGPAVERGGALRLVLAEPLHGCNKTTDVGPNDAVLSVRGACSFTDKAAAAPRAGLVVVFNPAPSCVAAGAGNASAAFLASLPPTVTVDGATGARLLAAAAVGAPVRAAPAPADGPDAGGLIIFGLAMTAVLAGATLAGRDEVKGGEAAASPRDAPGSPRGPPLSLDSPAAAAAFVGAAAGALLLAFCLPTLAYLALTALFLCAAGEAAARGAASAAARLGAPAPTHTGAAVGAALVAAWLALGPRVAWPAHDLLGLALLVSLPRALRVPNLAAATALVGLAACTDVWWVFLQPRATGGRSVMVAVATSTPALAFLAPLARGGPHAGFALLGFGDIALPGAVVAFAARWDAARAPGRFPATAAAAATGYGAGLVFTYAALLAGVGGGAGQPALLYLAPAVVGATATALAARGQLRAAWAGLDVRSGGSGDAEPLVV